MDRISQAFERIKVILGVSSGVIVQSQVETVAQIYHLDEAQQKKLAEMLEQNGIPLSAEEYPPAPEAEPKPVKKADPTPEERHTAFLHDLAHCRAAMSEEPQLAQQYSREIPILKAFIAEWLEDSPDRMSDWIIVKAVMELSSYRAREYRSEGWSCGTSLSHARELFRRRLCYLFCSDTLTELVHYCADPSEETNPHFEEILLLLVHRTPKTIVNRFTWK